MAKDNTLLYVGIGVVALLFLMKQNTPEIPQQQIAPGEPIASPQNQQLAEDISSGDVVLDVQDVPVISNGLDPQHTAQCLAFRSSGLSPVFYGNTCEDVFRVYG